MENDLTKKVDLVKASRSSLLALSFTKSSSQSYRLAVHLAQQAAFYYEEKVGPHTIHSVAFKKDREDAARAVSLLQYVGGWKSTQVFASGKVLQDRFRISQILRCYLEAAACEDWKAHCYTVVDDPFAARHYGDGPSIVISARPLQFSQEIDEFLFPCSYLNPFFRRKSDKHPSDHVHQIQAAAITIGCDMCPYFSVNEYKKVGKRMKVL